MHRFLVSALVLSAAPAFASDGPPFDCSKASSDVENTICNSAELAADDLKMDKLYEQAESKAGASKELVVAAQRIWLSQRNDCESSSDITTCLENSYDQRIAHLVARWSLETPFSTAKWDCDGAELTTVFYNTDTASMRAEFNGGTEVMLIARSGSGARYTNDTLGSSFWEKGPEAMFTWKHGASKDCKEKS